MEPLRFFKMQGAGNDFIVLDLLAHPLPLEFDFAALARSACERHRGIGADGLLTLEAPTPARGHSNVSGRMRMWNPDGTEDMCGNGLRCVAALAWRNRHATEPRFTLQTLAGTRAIEILSPEVVRAAMGMPIFAPEQVPFVGESPQFYELELAGRTFAATTLSTGSTHTVVFLPHPLEEAEFQALSPLAEHHPLFPARTTILWAVPDGPNRFRLRIWERGVGETLACGTGASAVAVAAITRGLANSPIEITSRGGTLNVEWAGRGEIFLTGPARFVFEGNWHAG